MDFNQITDLLTGKLTNWGTALIKLLPNIFLAAIVLVIGFYIAKFVRRISKKLIGKISHNITLNNLFSSVIYMVVLGIVIFTVLSILQLDKAVTSILAGAGILGLALAFAFQDIASNFMSGIFISFRKPLKVGDIVKLKDYMGKVISINLRDTVLQTFEGQTIIIPNKEVYQNAIDNYSYINKRRLDLSVGVSYGDDLAKVQQITLDAVKDIAERSQEDDVTVFFVEFGDSSINLSVRIWLNTPEQSVYVKVRSEAIMKIKIAYDANDIMIPFPIRTLDFGIKGGTTMTEMPVRFANQQ
ncbi:mechanosensitive ion channel family protein [Frigoriflavimonas asaccharolytica]|uniref:Small-conductance mechanosensitive channel n=1 Tax=Frigoriflavimonas asaccharolytica TaxID=2735899 RepID=A0A8J8G8U5_9FLAO|nr:mechanosensitive ion channel [Frigoriflavimonas asaccharolytica]NRS93218.1 small-conductance mechanosensitive channel [Frigoriflavimonas asaccharolytica]